MLVGETKSASWMWRTEQPCNALRNRGFIADWVPTNEVAGALFALEAGRYNLVVAPRIHWHTPEAGEEWVKAVRGYGCAWAYELDDDGWSPNIVNRQARLFEKEWLKGEQDLETERLERIRIVNQADGIIVSTKALAAVAAKFTDKPIHVVPNLIDTDWFMGRISDTKRIVSPLTIGWSGGVRDESDLELVAQAWTRIAKRYPSVKFIVHGITPKILAMSVPGDRLVLIGWTMLPDYPRTLVNMDIGCCAVRGGEDFNESKSPIKWFEMTLGGAACAVSPTVYGEVVTDGVDALVCDSVDAWDESLSRLVESEELRLQINDRAKQTVWEHHSIARKWPIWIETLSTILTDGQSQPSSGVQHAVSV